MVPTAVRYRRDRECMVPSCLDGRVPRGDSRSRPRGAARALRSVTNIIPRPSASGGRVWVLYALGMLSEPHTVTGKLHGVMYRGDPGDTGGCLTGLYWRVKSARDLVRSKHASSATWGSRASTPPRSASEGFRSRCPVVTLHLSVRGARSHPLPQHPPFIPKQV